MKAKKTKKEDGLNSEGNIPEKLKADDDLLSLKKKKIQQEIENLQNEVIFREANLKRQKKSLRVKLVVSLISVCIIAFTVFLAIKGDVSNRENQIELKKIENERTLSEIDKNMRLIEQRENNLLVNQAKFDLELIHKRKDSLSILNSHYKKNIDLKVKELSHIKTQADQLKNEKFNLNILLEKNKDDLSFSQTAYHLNELRIYGTKKISEDILLVALQAGSLRLKDTLTKWENSQNLLLRLNSAKLNFRLNPNDIISQENLDKVYTDLIYQIIKSTDYSQALHDAFWYNLKDPDLFTKQLRIPIVLFSINALYNENFGNEKNRLELGQALMFAHFTNLIDLKNASIKHYFKLYTFGVYSLEMGYETSLNALTRFAPELGVMLYIDVIRKISCYKSYEFLNDFMLGQYFITNMQVFIEPAESLFELLAQNNNINKNNFSKLNKSDLDNLGKLCGLMENLSTKYKDAIDLYLNPNIVNIDAMNDDALKKLSSEIYAD